MEEEISWEKQYREAQQKRRSERLPIRTEEIMSLTELGYEVKAMTEYQFRINKLIDIYPLHHRFHDLRTNKRGSYKPGNLKEFIKEKLKN